jgi:hypothetical protein
VDRIPVGARYSASVQTGPVGPPSLLYNGYRVFHGDKKRPGRDADSSPLLVPWSRNDRAIPLPPQCLYKGALYRTACTQPQCLYKGELYRTTCTKPQCLNKGALYRTACTEPQCLYKGALYRTVCTEPQCLYKGVLYRTACTKPQYLYKGALYLHIYQ